MSEDAIRAIARDSATGLDIAPVHGGWVWQSSREQGPHGTNKVTVPGGLHISCGLADMETALSGVGRFTARDGAFTLVRLPPEGAAFRTRTRPGPVRSAGLHLPNSAFEGIEGAIGKLIAKLDERALLAVTGGEARAVLRLTRPLDPVHASDVRHLLLASRGLELMALAVSVFATPAKNRLDARRSARAHRRIAADVRDLLESDLAAARPIRELARLVASSPRVMTQAFREAYNESIGSYLTRRRMEEAMLLLEAGASVAEAAYRVGYSPNAFSTAFKRYYGRAPSKLFR
jgi:AraC family transcriptional activator of pyochelin receptor